MKFSKFGGKDNGSSFKAALLSGPPGIGKTTTATLVCKVRILVYWDNMSFSSIIHMQHLFIMQALYSAATNQCNESSNETESKSIVIPLKVVVASCYAVGLFEVQ